MIFVLINFKGCNIYVYWVDKDVLGIGIFIVGCIIFELFYVFLLKLFD